jgi:hypothetical protein
LPYAKIDVGFIRQHLAAAPEKNRAAAIALYVELVLTSAELLLDGVLPRRVVEAGAAEIGISRGRYARREIASVATSLAECGLVEVAEDGTWTLTYWHDHHHSRDYVDGRRKQDAERKRGARGQLTIGEEAPAFHKPRPSDVRSGQTADSRAHTRRRASSESKDHSSSSGSRHAPPDDDLSLRLEHLGVNDRALIAAAATDPERAAAWIDHATEHADRNAAGYFRTNFITGAWPPNGNGKPHLDPDERREHFLTTSGYLLPDDELEYQLRHTYAATDDDVIEALDRAADLRRTASVST